MRRFVNTVLVLLMAVILFYVLSQSSERNMAKPTTNNPPPSSLEERVEAMTAERDALRAQVSNLEQSKLVDLVFTATLFIEDRDAVSGKASELSMTGANPKPTVDDLQSLYNRLGSSQKLLASYLRIRLRNAIGRLGGGVPLPQQPGLEISDLEGTSISNEGFLVPDED